MLVFFTIPFVSISWTNWIFPVGWGSRSRSCWPTCSSSGSGSRSTSSACPGAKTRFSLFFFLSFFLAFHFFFYSNTFCVLFCFLMGNKSFSYFFPFFLTFNALSTSYVLSPFFLSLSLFLIWIRLQTYFLFVSRGQKKVFFLFPFFPYRLLFNFSLNTSFVHSFFL